MSAMVWLTTGNQVHWEYSLAMVPMIVDGATQYLNLRESNNWLRLSTGLLFGVGLAVTAYLVGQSFRFKL